MTSASFHWTRWSDVNRSITSVRPYLVSAICAVQAVTRRVEPFPLLTDEREVARPQAGICDIGVYESDGDYVFASGFE